MLFPMYKSCNVMLYCCIGMCSSGAQLRACQVIEAAAQQSFNRVCLGQLILLHESMTVCSSAQLSAWLGVD